jgi:NADPH:quinone reductase-like Zn-dependent oxidoreductase
MSDLVDWPAAGGFPEAFTTAHDALFTQCGLAMGERVLVHGAAGGVGIAGVQLAVAAGAMVIATVRSEGLRAEVERLGRGSCTVVGSEPEQFEASGVFDVILELVGGVNMAANLRSLATGGRISVIGVGGGGSKAELDLLTLMQRRGRIHGSTLRTRSLEEKADAARRIERHVLPLLGVGAVTVPVEATFPLEEAPAAFERFAAGGKLGKIVLTVGS